MRRTSARLADSREIIYFDLSDDVERVLDRPRELPEGAAAGLPDAGS
jgi:UDPglucose--hexose-1-phosphate uridylyltransferase